MRKSVSVFKAFASVVFILTPLLLRGGYFPIIFVHGNKSEALPDFAWKSWNPGNYSTAMTRILDEHYGGYIEGKPLNCHEGTQLQPMQTTKVLYNFSYYHPDGSHGAIGSNGCLEPVSDWERGVYNSVVSNGSWAKNLADFIDKVLEATGTEKVDIVGRATIAYYVVFGIPFTTQAVKGFPKDAICRLHWKLWRFLLRAQVFN